MGYITIENFIAGVDRRRPVYAGTPGSLWEGINCHLSRGGDLEKRKKYSSGYVLPANQTFGLTATDAGLYTFGSAASPAVPAGITYQRLAHPDGAPTMTRVLSTELFDGLLYVIAQFDNGDIIHFYNGVVVQDWLSGIVRPAMVDNAGIAAHLAQLIDADAAYAASSAGPTITIVASVAGTPFDLSTIAENVTGGADDQTATAMATVANVPGVAEVLATATFTVTAGTSNPGTNKVSTIKISGIEVLNVAVDWVTSNATTAANIATQINSYASSPEYSATSSGDTVTISAAAASGATPNGFTVVVTPAGTVNISGAGAATAYNTSMQGGKTAVAGQAQQATVAIGGTFEVGDRFTVILDDKRFGADGNPRGVGTLAHTQEKKVWSPYLSIVNFSGAAEPTGWNSAEGGDIGAGNINAATNTAGSATVTALETYQGDMAIFSERAVQIWDVDVDESLNRPKQTIKNTGTRSPRSVLAFSDIDVIYLDSYGIRSLRAREATNAAQVAGIGALIDPLVIDYMKTLTDDQIMSAVAAIEPSDGRFWLALGARIFVFSYFPETKVSGWSWYEPGLQFTEFAVFDNRIYARAGDVVYLYGGASGEEYDDAETAQGKVTCWIPFLSMKKDGTYKHLLGVDIAATNDWDMELLVDPNDLTQISPIGSMPGVTYGLDDVGVVGHYTHISPRLTCQQDGFASLSKVSLFFDGGDDSGRG